MQLVLSDKQFLIDFLRICVVILWISACNVGGDEKGRTLCTYFLQTSSCILPRCVLHMVAVLHRSKTVQMHRYLSDVDL